MVLTIKPLYGNILFFFVFFFYVHAIFNHLTAAKEQLNITFCRNNDMWVFFSSDCTVREWDLLTMTSVRVLQGHKGPIRDVKVRMTYLFYTLLFVGFVNDIICTYGKKVWFFVLIPIALLAISQCGLKQKKRKKKYTPCQVKFFNEEFQREFLLMEKNRLKKGKSLDLDHVLVYCCMVKKKWLKNCNCCRR